jgi:hypothetical protein
MNYEAFYRSLFAPIEAILGPLDRNTVFHIVGFDCGGPINFCTIGADKGDRFVTYITCELAVRMEQKPSSFGRYEILVTSDDDKWVTSTVTKLGRLSLEEQLGHGHTVDIGVWGEPTALIQGIVLEELCEVPIDGNRYGIMRCIGITRPEMEYAQKCGSGELLKKLREAGIYPNTTARRESSV